MLRSILKKKETRSKGRELHLFFIFGTIGVGAECVWECSERLWPWVLLLWLSMQSLRVSHLSWLLWSEWIFSLLYEWLFARERIYVMCNNLQTWCNHRIAATMSINAFIIGCSLLFTTLWCPVEKLGTVIACALKFVQICIKYVFSSCGLWSVSVRSTLSFLVWNVGQRTSHRWIKCIRDLKRAPCLLLFCRLHVRVQDHAAGSSREREVTVPGWYNGFRLFELYNPDNSFQMRPWCLGGNANNKTEFING